MSSKKIPAKKKSIYYIDNKQFYEKMKDYIYACREAEERGELYPIIPNYLGECFTKIAHRLASRYRFAGYSYKQEMIDDGIETCIKYIRSFNPDKSTNPFSYFTQTIKTAFFQRINIERKETYIKLKSMEKMMLTNDGFYDSEDGFSIPFEMYENMSQYISDYETALDEKKKKVSKKKMEMFGDDDDEESIV